MHQLCISDTVTGLNVKKHILGKHIPLVMIYFTFLLCWLNHRKLYIVLRIKGVIEAYIAGCPYTLQSRQTDIMTTRKYLFVSTLNCYVLTNREISSRKKQEFL